MNRWRHRRRAGAVLAAETRLSDLSPGEKAQIVRVSARGEIKKRLLEMGVVPGTEVEVERVAPLGDPIELRLLGYHLSLRRSEAQTIEVRRQG